MVFMYAFAWHTQIVPSRVPFKRAFSSMARRERVLVRLKLLTLNDSGIARGARPLNAISGIQHSLLVWPSLLRAGPYITRQRFKKISFNRNNFDFIKFCWGGTRSNSHGFRLLSEVNSSSIAFSQLALSILLIAFSKPSGSLQVYSTSFAVYVFSLLLSKSFKSRSSCSAALSLTRIGCHAVAF